MNVDELDETYRRYFPIIRGKAQRMLRDPEEALDVAQETFTKMWSKRHTLKEPDARLAWLYRTATRLAIDRLRRHPPRDNGPLVEPASGRDEAAQRESRAALEALARSLPRKELTALILSRVDGMRQDEVGAVMRVSDRTVRRLLTSAARRLERFRAAEAFA